MGETASGRQAGATGRTYYIGWAARKDDVDISSTVDHTGPPHVRDSEYRLGQYWC